MIAFACHLSAMSSVIVLDRGQELKRWQAEAIVAPKGRLSSPSACLVMAHRVALVRSKPGYTHTSNSKNDTMKGHLGQP